MTTKFIFILLFPLFFCSTKSYANETIWHVDQGSHREIYSLYDEEGLWHVSLFVVEPGKLQVHQWKKAFSTQKIALNYLKNFLSAKKLSQPDSSKQYSEIFVRTEDPNEIIWPTENEWSWEWEKKFAQWVTKTFHSNFYLDNNIATDCADAATAIRWIFSRIYKLPAGNHLAASGALFTNESIKNEWKNLPTHEDWRQDKRFLAALNYILDNTYTHSVFKDGYPVAITQEAFLAGTHVIMLGDGSGHTLVVNYVNSQVKYEMPIRMLQSTVPRQVRSLYESTFWSGDPVKEQTAILRSRWPVKNGQKWELVAANKMPHYSLEQFDPKFPGQKKSFLLALFARIAPNFVPDKVITEGLNEIVTKLSARYNVVNEGYAFCRAKGCPEGSAAYEDWSTPSRDKTILTFFNDLEGIVTENSEITEEARKLWEEGLEKKFVSIDGVDYKLKQFLFTWRYQMFSSDPNIEPERRWGLAVNPVKLSLTEKLNSLLKQREELVGKNSCSNCAYESKEWIESNSYALDIKIQNLNLALTQYCQLYSISSCNSLKQLLKESSLQAGQMNLSISDWLERGLWFNADPRVHNDYRWGKIQEKIIPIHGLFSAESLISKNEFMLSGAEDKWRLIDLKKKKEISIPQDYKIEHISIETDLVLLSNIAESKIAVFDPKNQKISSPLLLKGKLKKARWLSPSIIGIFIDDNFKMIKFSTERFSLLTAVDCTLDEANTFINLQYNEGAVTLTYPKDILVFKMNNGKHVIFDFTGSELKKTEIKIQLPETQYYFPVTHISNQFYLINNSYVVSKGSGNTTAYPYSIGKNLGNNWHLIYNGQGNGEVYRALLNDEFKTQNRDANISNYYSYSESKYINTYAGSVQKVYSVTENNNLKEVMNISNYLNFIDASVITLFENGQGIFDLLTKKLVYKAKEFYFPEGYVTKKSSWFFSLDSNKSALHKTPNSGIPVVTGLTSYISALQLCAVPVKLKIGGYSSLPSPEGYGCMGDRNESDGIALYLSGNQSYYIPAGNIY